jgi:hypothetical protein
MRRLTIRAWHFSTLTVLLCARRNTLTRLWWRCTTTHRAGTVTRSRTRWQSIGSTSFENPIPLIVGCRMLRDHDCQLDQPCAPDGSTALLSAAHRMLCGPIPLTGTCALAPP